MKLWIAGKEYDYAEGTPFLEISKEHQKEYPNTIVLAVYNNKLQELCRTVQSEGTLSFVTTAESNGRRAYRRSLMMLLEKAIYNLYKTDVRLRAMFILGNGKYCELEGIEISKEILGNIHEEMERLVKLDLPIQKSAIHTDGAVERFREYGMWEKEKLFRYRRSSHVNLYDIDGFKDYFYGYMVPSTGYLGSFRMELFGEGFLLSGPDVDVLGKAGYAVSKKLYATMKESVNWAKKMEIKTIGELNEQISAGHIRDVILLQEAEMEQRIGKLAEQIVSQPGKKFVMVAGPSASGKTTFSHRLAIQLRAHGRKPHPIGLDNFYVNREDTPLDENGNYDFECLEAIDIELLNSVMARLLAGERVLMPYFNFKTGKQETKGEYLQIGEEDILVIEGIHGLNAKLTYMLPEETKFKVFISPLTQISIDEHNEIPPADARLIRRLVRDSQSRGTSAAHTIDRWKSVRKGEEKYIFPFEGEADVIFNSALIYEMAVLKMYVEPLLFGIPKESPEYIQANRLLKFLDYFLQVPSEEISQNSILREFIGGSCFHI